MSTCKVCGCTDERACQGGCFWVDKQETICSSCAINNITFENKITGKHIKVIATQNNPYAQNGLQLRVELPATPYEKAKSHDVTLLDFKAYYKEVTHE